MKKVKVPVFLYLLSILYFFSGALCTRAANDPMIVEKYLTQEGAVLYVRNLPDAADTENMTYQVGTESCVVVESTTVAESSEKIYTLILCDTSLSSMRKSADQMKEVLKDVVANRMPGENFAIMGMDKDAQLLCDYTNEYLTLKNVIDNMPEEMHKTYVFSTLYEAIEDLNALENAYKRIIVITDGVDSGGVGYGKSELEKKLEETPYPIYALGISANDNQQSLQTLYAISRATGAECFTLNETEDLLEIVQALSKDYAMKRVTVNFPKTLMDGSTKNSQLSVEVDGTLYQAQVKITLPFASTSEKEEENTGEGQPPKEEHGTEPPSTIVTPEPDLNEEVNDGKIHILGADIPRPVFWISIIILCALIAGIVCILIKKKKKIIQPPSEPERDPYKELDDKLAAEQKEDSHTKEGKISETISQNTRSGETHVLGSVTERLSRENANSRVTKLEQHTFTLTDVKDAGRNWQCRFGESFVIGRDPGRCRVVVSDDKTVSSQHCELGIQDNAFYIRDLDSANGTKLNGNRIESQKNIRISSGAILEIGKSKYQVKLE